MQRVAVVAVGKLNEPFYAQGVAEYTRRLQPFCRFICTELAEEKLREKHAGQKDIEKALEKEAFSILSAVPQTARLVALCVEGRTLTSPELAAYIEQTAMETGAGEIAFVIGSSHGLAKSVKQKAALQLSISSMTLPHQLARLVLCEQIYRAFNILGHTKYHK